DSAIRNRVAHFAEKAESLFSLSIFFVVLCPAMAARRGLTASLLELPANPHESLGELRSRLSSKAAVRLDNREIAHAEAALRQKVESFRTQVSDFLSVRLLAKDEAFRVLKRTLNFDPLKLLQAKRKYDTFLDFYLAESHLECHRTYLRVDDFYVKVLT